MSIITSFCMFFLSFFPLWISVIFIDTRSILESSRDIYTEIISISLILVATLISLFFLKIVFNPKNQNGLYKYTLISAHEEKTITSEFLLAYILPLFAFNFTIWHEVVLFLIFFLVFMFLCIRHNHFSVNVLLEVMNYRFYNCQLLNEDNITINKVVISRNILNANINKDILLHFINNEYCVEIKRNK